MILASIFKLPPSFAFVQIPTDEDPRGYVEVPSHGGEFKWGNSSLLVSDIAEFYNHISFHLNRDRYSVILSPTGKDGFSVLVMNDEQEIVLAEDFSSKKDMYLAFKALCKGGEGR